MNTFQKTGDVIFIYNKDDIEFNYISLSGVKQ